MFWFVGLLAASSEIFTASHPLCTAYDSREPTRVHYPDFKYLGPKSRKNNSPEQSKTAQRAIILHTFGVQVAV